MSHKTTIASLVILLLTAPTACAAGDAASKDAKAGAETKAAAGAGVALDTEEQKTIYALGLVVSQNLAPFGLSEAEVGILVAGLKDGVSGATPRVDLQAFGPKINTLAQSRAVIVAAAEAKESDAYIQKMAAEPGASKTASGLVFIETQAGTGATPAVTDTVSVHYHGTLRDGTVFDSSRERGQPAEFPVNGVIPCWTEALQKMKVGGKAKITCPAAIAYGDRGAPPKIKPGAALTFEVELLGIGASAPAAPGAGAPGAGAPGAGAPGHEGHDHP